MAQGTSKQLLATDTGDPVTDVVLPNLANAISVTDQRVLDLLQQIVDRLDVLNEYLRLQRDGF